MSTYTVMISGSHNYAEVDRIFTSLHQVTRQQSDHQIVVFSDPDYGLYDTVTEYAKELGWEVQQGDVKPDLLLAFPVKRCQGTWEQVHQAWKNHIPVRVFAGTDVA